MKGSAEALEEASKAVEDSTQVLQAFSVPIITDMQSCLDPDLLETLDQTAGRKVNQPSLLELLDGRVDQLRRPSSRRFASQPVPYSLNKLVR